MAWMKDKESRFILVNESFGNSSGKKPEALTGKTDYDVWPKDLAERYRADDREVMESRRRKRVEEPLAESKGKVIWIETIKTPVYSKAGEVVGTVGIARDITRRKKMEEDIRHMAQHDALTGLPNRRLFINILKVELAQSRRHRSKLAIMFIDLDRFKEVNDTLGHEAGDSLLKEVAERFRLAVRESDTVARLGGDEFNIILSDLVRAEAISEIALKITDSLRKPILLDGHKLHVTASIGISVYPDDSSDPDTLQRFADIAMYHAKESGRNQFRFYNPIINTKSLERMKFETSMRQAIERDELILYYQPLVDISSKQIVSAEALVRWRHPDRGLLEPGQFIPDAEETGLISLIDEWVLGAACRQVKKWRDDGLHPVCVTVNLSARQFCNPELGSNVARTLEETGLEPECLNLEITESTVMGNIAHATEKLAELANIGIYITIEDFGTGYSSLNYLKRLPISYLKIDKSFIRGISTDQENQAIISAVTLMAHKMNMKVIAEGVETESQLSFLGETKCDEAQGYLFSRPLPPEEFGELLAAA
jgi:diguanylate cyclase (GGDEF)-like protein/PAS domain S-box-containing protein